MNNVAEGFGRRKSQRDFIRFLNYAQSSCSEVKSITYLIEDMKYLELNQLLAIRQQSEHVRAKIIALIMAIRKNLKSK